MRSNSGVAAIVCFLFFAACSKNSSDNSITNNSPKLLRQFKALSGTDTTRKYTFTYDSQNRIATSSAAIYENGIFQGEVTHSFSYNGNDSLPVSKRIDYSQNGTVETAYEFLSYDASGKMIIDSVDQDASGFYFVYKFQYFSDHILISTSYFDTILSRISLLNGNIVSESDTLYSTVIWTDPNKIDIQMSFDNHPNPFYKTAVRRPIYYVPELYVDDYFMQPMKNNFLQYNRVRTGSDVETESSQASYSYDADGYPVTMTQTMNGATYSGYYYY